MHDYTLTWKSVKYAITTPSNRFFFGPLLLLGVGGALLIYNAVYLLGIALVLLCVLPFAMLFLSSVLIYNKATRLGKRALLHNWVYKGTSVEEQESRKRLLGAGSAMDLESMFAKSGLEYEGPMYNTDGTLMLPGNIGVDIKGNLYGATDISPAVFNEDTGLFSDPSSAYESPMNSFHDTNSFDSSSSFH